jgi:3-oxoacyl-[acyl-carrier protein] reductase
VDLALAGKTAFVTGASGGIGRALAEAFAAEGANLVLHAGSRLQELERHVAARPWRERALCVQADVTVPEQLERCARQGVERFGRLDLCVANAGRWPRENLLLHQAPLERIRGTIETNLMGALWTARAFLAELERSGPRSDGVGAAIVFIGSTAGRFGERHHCEYSASKAGLYGLLASLKNEIVLVDPRGRVNLVEPGWTVTHMARPELDQPGTIARVTATMALRQLASAEDIARAVLFFASSAMARHVTGSVLTVAGGMEGRTLWQPEQIDEAAVRARHS